MSELIPFIVALMMGLIIYRLIHRQYPWHEPLDVLVSLWLGTGVCSLIVFYSILFLGGFNPFVIQLSVCAVILLLCFSCRLRPLLPTRLINTGSLGVWIKLMPLMLLAVILLSGLSYYNLFGDWDAWSFWNFRARFLVEAGQYWQDIYAYGIQAKHPWLLPHWTVFGWVMTGAQSAEFPCFSAQVFTLMTIASVFFAVLSLVGQLSVALLAALWLVSIPYFMIHGISQYADILMAGLIVINMMLLVRLKAQPSSAQAITLGMMLGIMCFTKDEGMVSAVIMVFLIGHVLTGWHRKGHFYKPFVLSLLVIVVGVLLQKYWMWPAPQGVNAISWGHFFDYQRWYFILAYFLKVYTHYLYGGIILIPILLALTAVSRRWDAASGLMVRFLLVFISVFYLLYVLVRQDLEWRLWTTSYRLTFQLLPLGIVLLFYRLFAKR